MDPDDPYSPFFLKEYNLFHSHALNMCTQFPQQWHKIKSDQETVLGTWIINLSLFRGLVAAVTFGSDVTAKMSLPKCHCQNVTAKTEDTKDVVVNVYRATQTSSTLPFACS